MALLLTLILLPLVFTPLWAEDMPRSLVKRPHQRRVRVSRWRRKAGAA